MTEKRRIRTIWRVRQRYHRLARIAALLGATVAAVIVGLLWVRAVASGGSPGVRFYLLSALGVAAAAHLSRRVVIARWRCIRSDYEP